VNSVLTALSQTSANALALTKRQFYELDGVPFAEGIGLGARVNALARAHPDFRTAIAAFLKYAFRRWRSGFLAVEKHPEGNTKGTKNTKYTRQKHRDTEG